MKKFNNKGYMLIEIILASVIAVGVAYFITDLVIKLKNKNDDLLVKTLVSTDQTIIYNELKRDLFKNGEETFSCDKIKVNGNTFRYDSVGDGFNDNDFINIITDYADVGTLECTNKNNKLYIRIPISVKQLEENYDVVIDTISPECQLSVGSDNVITALVTENESEVAYSVWKKVEGDGDNEVETEVGTGETFKITDIGKYRYYVKDGSANEGKCGIEVEKIKSYKYCDGDDDLSGDTCTETSYQSASEHHDVGGECWCRPVNIGSTGGVGGHKLADCYENRRCVCRDSGFTESRNSCTDTITYSCPKGWSRNGTSCYYYTNYDAYTGYKCMSSGFNRINNNNSYCWKVFD